MVNWLSHSLEQYTIAWILVSSLVGGIVGSGVKFLFEDLLRPVFGVRRETRETIRKYTTPLVRSAESLERRINNFARNRSENWYETSDYYRLSTLYIFADYLSWVRIIEEEFGFLPYQSSRYGRRFNLRLRGPFKALSSFSYFQWSHDAAEVDSSQIPRLILTAMGEVTLDEERAAPLHFSQFALAYERDAQLRRWFEDLDKFLRRASADDPYVIDRLIAAGANLRALIYFLDKKSSLVPRRRVSNIDLIPHDEVAAQIKLDFPNLLVRRRSILERAIHAVQKYRRSSSRNR